MDGKGIFSWGNGVKYKGDYKNNKREGNGVYSFGCNLYDGFWLNNLPHGEGILLYDGLRIVGHFRYGKIFEMKEGKGVTREMTQKLSLDSRTNVKSLDESNNKALERSEDDSRNVRTEKYDSEARSKIGKKNKKKENKNNVSRYSQHNKSKSKEKEKEDENENNINKKNKSKRKDKEKKSPKKNK